MKRTHIQILSFVIIICFIIISSSSILFLSFSQLSFAQKEDKGDNDEKDEDKDKLVVRSHINLQNVDLENTKFIRVIGFINGEDVKQDIPISSIDKNKKTLNVDLKVNEENDIVKASSPDEFFVCAYQVGDVQQQESTPIPKFDCNEGDISGNPTEISLFSSGSQVYAHSKAVYDANLNKTTNDKQSDTVKIEILAPLADKKDTEKLKIAAMIKGQIKSEVIQDVQAELDKSKDSTIKRIFTFDRDTDIGRIQIGDRYHACVSSNDLSPPEGTECEKRVVHQFDKVNSLPAR